MKKNNTRTLINLEYNRDTGEINLNFSTDEKDHELLSQILADLLDTALPEEGHPAREFAFCIFTSVLRSIGRHDLTKDQISQLVEICKGYDHPLSREQKGSAPAHFPLFHRIDMSKPKS